MMVNSLPSLFVASCSVMLMSADAALVFADFRAESNLPDHGTGQPKIYESLNQSLGSGYELDGSDFVSNVDGWGGGDVWIDLSQITSTTYLLQLDSQDTWDFQTFQASITNIYFDIPGEQIIGVTLLTNGLTVPQIAPSISFTGNSILVSYSSVPDIFNFTGGSATFEIEVASSAIIPEPSSTIGLAGLLGSALLFRSRRRR